MCLSMPSWWMPDSCAKALRPTIALLNCTGNEVAADTSLEARVSMVVSMPVQNGSTSLRTLIAITTSSSAALPARSPMPLMVHSICRAPALTPDERIGHRHAEIVVAMHREARLVGVRHGLAQLGHELEVFLRHGVADRVRDVDGGGAGLDRGLDAAAQEIELGAGAVLGRPFDVVGVAPRAGDLRDHHLVDLVRLLLELVFHVHRRGGQEGMDALALGRLDRLGAAVDVLEGGARQPADHRVLGAGRDLLDGGEIAFRGDREAGLDDVDAHVVEQLGDLELLVMGHGGAGTLLAVAQGGVEDDDAVLLGLRWRTHGNGPSRFAPAPRFGRSGVPGDLANPLSAQAQAPSRPSGADKQQEPAENEGSIRPGLNGPRSDRANETARQHCPKSSLSAVPGWRKRVNRALTLGVRSASM